MLTIEQKNSIIEWITCEGQGEQIMWQELHDADSIEIEQFILLQLYFKRTCYEGNIMTPVTVWYNTQTEAFFNLPFQYQNDTNFRVILEKCNMAHKWEYRYSVIENN